MKQTLLFIFFSLLVGCGLQAQSIAKQSGPIASAISIKKSIKIYPNPTAHYIGLSDDTSITQIRILSLIGKEVKLIEVVPGGRYNVEDLQNGMYLVQMINEDHKVVVTQRLKKL